MKRSLVLAFLLVLLSASTALAAEQTITVTLKVESGFLGKAFLGSVVMKHNGTPELAEGTWTFQGTIDGKAATASGRAEVRWTGKAYEGTVTQVDTWQMPGLPTLPLPFKVSLTQGSGQTIWATAFLPEAGPITTPLNMQGLATLPIPAQSAVALSLTNAAGMEEIKGLPRTGDVPVSAYLAALALLFGAGTLFGAFKLLRRPA